MTNSGDFIVIQVQSEEGDGNKYFPKVLIFKKYNFAGLCMGAAFYKLRLGTGKLGITVK